MADTNQWMTFAEELLRTGYDLAGSAAPAILDDETRQGDIRLMAVLLIARSLSNARGVRSMIRENRVVEARILARCIIENALWLVGLSEDPHKFRQDMVNQDLNRRGAAAQTLLETGKMADEVEQTLRKWLRHNPNWKKSKTVSPKQTARDAQLYEAYPFYEMLSSDAHPTTSALNRYVNADEEMEITEIVLDPEPTQQELAESISLACYGLVIVFKAGSTVLHFAKSETIDALARKYLEMMKATH